VGQAFLPARQAGRPAPQAPATRTSRAASLPAAAASRRVARP